MSSPRSLLLVAGLIGLAAPVGSQAPSPTVSTLALEGELPSFGRLGGVAIAPDGTIYVSSFHASVFRISTDGVVDTMACCFNGASGNAVDSSGNLLQADFNGNAIARITPDGVVTTLADEGLDGPVGLTVDGSGNVFAVNCRNNTVSKVTPDGQVTSFASSPLFACPNGLTIGPSGSLYVVSFSNGIVARVTPEGSVSELATIPDGGNAHIAFARGSFYITKIETNKLYRVSRAGEIEHVAGTGEVGLGDGPAAEATLARPNGIAVTPDGRYLVMNNLDGEWRGNQPSKLVIRVVDLGPGS